MRLNLLTIALLAVVTELPPNCFAQDTATRPASAQIVAIDTAVQPFVDRHEVAGVVTLVAQQGKIVHLGAVGLSDIESQQPMRVGNRFSIASMTKPIVATAMMILVSEAKLDVNDPLSKYIPAFAEIKDRDGNPPARRLTIRDAVTHTAGLTGPQLFRGSLADHVEKLATRPLAFEPDSKWQYSAGINVAGRIVEIVSEQTLKSCKNR